MKLRRFFEMAALATVLAVGLTGCIHADIGITFKNGGTGTFTITTGLSKQVASLAGSTSGGDGVAQIKQQFDDAGKKQVQQFGGTYKVTDDGTYINETWTHDFTSVDQLNQLIKDGQTSTSASSGGTGITTSSNSTAIQVAKVGSDYHVTGLLDFTLDTSQGGSQAAALLQDARIQLTLTFPSLKAHNSDGVVKDNTITYTAKVNEKKTIDATGGDALLSGFLVPAIIGLVVLAAIGAVLFFVLRRRTPPPATAAMPASTPYPGAYPSSGYGDQPTNTPAQ
ncbi:MAG: hypothetical protein H0X24_24620 [Ktedonobacterales bacterium]|nr:hypothetical protein [Ktedonobacterales bacterium]